MLNMDELKDKVLATAGNVVDKTAEVAKAAAEKTRLLGKLTRISTDMAKERDILRRTYAEIGKKYYEKHKNDADPEFQQAIADVEQSLKLMDSKKKQADAIKTELTKANVDCADYDVDYDDVENTDTTTEADTNCTSGQEPQHEPSANDDSTTDEKE